MAYSLPSNPSENRRAEKRRTERNSKNIEQGLMDLVHSLCTTPWPSTTSHQPLWRHARQDLNYEYKTHGVHSVNESVTVDF